MTYSKRMVRTRFICARKSWHVDHRGRSRHRKRDSDVGGTPKGQRRATLSFRYDDLNLSTVECDTQNSQSDLQRVNVDPSRCPRLADDVPA